MKLKIGGYIETSLNDVLFHPSFVIFFSGCNFRCPWCQNGPLVLGEGYWIDINDLLEKIKENFIIEYVQATGGEPTLQKDGLKELFKEVRELGLKNSLDTNGSNPEAIKEIKDLIDHIAIDIKAPKEKYKILTGIFDDFEKIDETLNVIKDLDFIEIRTTWVPNLLTENDIIKIVEYLNEKLDKFYFILQQFIPSDTVLDPKFRNIKPTDPEKLKEIAEKIKERGVKVFIRTVSGLKKI